MTRFAGSARTPWIRMTQGAIVTLVIAAPTLIIEEDWHGRPMLDQPGHLWVIPTIIVAFAFALGGAIGTRGVDELWRNLWEGLIVGGSVAGLLLVADVGRRAMHDKAISEGVLRLWVEAAILSVVIASLGGAISYFHATRSR